MSAGRTYVLERSQRLELPIERAFEFFSRARNLTAITPPWMGFEVVTPGPIEMRPGALIDYRLKLHGVPVRWRTRIAVWEPPVRFIDVQIRGPYALWEHTHTFEPCGEHAVRIDDRVRYAMPLGMIGRAAHAAFVKRDLDRVFAYRERAVAERLGLGSADG